MQYVTADKKITKATFKSFIKKAIADNNLFVKSHSSFNGMSDMVESVESDFVKVQSIDLDQPNTFGISGAWVVGGSDNWFNFVDCEEYYGINCYNCCGSFTVYAKK